MGIFNIYHPIVWQSFCPQVVVGRFICLQMGFAWSICSTAVIGSPYCPKQFSNYFSDEVCYIIYLGSLGWSLLLRATESHSLNQSGYHIHIGNPCHLNFNNATCTHSPHPRGQHHSYYNWVWGSFVGLFLFFHLSLNMPSLPENQELVLLSRWLLTLV